MELGAFLKMSGFLNNLKSHIPVSHNNVLNCVINEQGEAVMNDSVHIAQCTSDWNHSCHSLGRGALFAVIDEDHDYQSTACLHSPFYAASVIE